MTTRQAVWPRELIERRAAAAAVQAELRAAENFFAPGHPRAPGHDHVVDPARERRIAGLRAALVALPCPHWDMQLDPSMGSDWICEACGTVIVPDWVPLGEQEQHLRRLRHLVAAPRR